MITALVAFCNYCAQKNSNSSVEEKYCVTYVNLLDIIQQTGEVKSTEKVEVKSEASGKIEKIFIKEGEYVKKGDRILSIDPSRLLIRKQSIDLEIKKSLIQLSIAEKNYTNALQLQKTGTISENNLFELKTTYELNKISYQQQLLELNDIKDQLLKTEVTAPIDGIVISLEAEEGEIVVSATSSYQTGTQLATIANMINLEVVTQIGEADYTSIKKGQHVVIRLLSNDTVKTSGDVKFIALNAKKSTNDQLSTFDVRVGIDSLIPGIVPGITVLTEFILLDKKNILGIPYHFLQKDDTSFYVQKLSNNSRIKTPVKIGNTDYKYYEIIGGIQKNDSIIFIESKELPEIQNNKRRKK